MDFGLWTLNCLGTDGRTDGFDKHSTSPLRRGKNFKKRKNFKFLTQVYFCNFLVMLGLNHKLNLKNILFSIYLNIFEDHQLVYI
jgi:hypothetical protein